MTGGEVVTKSYTSESDDGSINDVLEQAVADKNEIIFTVSPTMMPDTLKAAVYHTDIRFLNCSVGQSHPSVRCYHGKLYEAAFLMGILAADSLLVDGDRSAGGRTIGYVARSAGSMSVTDLNAFAIGVSLIDPMCRIKLKYISDDNCDLSEQWRSEGVKMFADFEYSTVPGINRTPGVFRILDGKDVFIGTPYFNWGKYYVQIVQSVISGAWDLNEVLKLHSAANYWFGLSSGVVDIRTPDLPYQTKKMLSFFKNAIISGSIDPFSGELRSQNVTIQENAPVKNSHISGSLEKITVEQIVSMDWLNDNIDGTMPLGGEE